VLPILLAAGLEVHCLGAGRPWHFLPVVRRLGRMLAERRTQLIQTFLFHANLVGRLAARRAGVPCVLSGIRVAERRSRWHLWLDRATQHLVDRHVCVSASVARFAQEQAGLRPERLVVIPNGVDLRRFAGVRPADLSTLGIYPRRPLAMFIGRLDRQKGVSWLLDSAPDWLGQLPEAELLVVGRGPMVGHLGAQCRRLGISGRVHFAPWRSDIPAVLAASTLLLLPSEWEGMPNVVAEAMASGLPVVAADVEGVRELLGPDAPQQIVPYGDSAALSAAVVRLVQNPAAARAIGEKNRARVANHFSIEQMVAAYQQLWHSLLASSGRP
jgi:glycosyltransferase involved in cell wall biosynthesis